MFETKPELSAIGKKHHQLLRLIEVTVPPISAVPS
jgi:hypothetical protein